jgi:hypothetical protein
VAPLEIRLTDPVEALVVEQALALVRELKQTCQSAPHGQVLARAEILALTRGRELTRQALESVLNQQAEAVEKKGRRDEPAPAEVPGTTKARRHAR